jgi:hypothetical protein
MWTFILRDKMFKITTNLMCKVLKRTQLHEYHFSQTLLHYFMHLQFKFDVYDNDSLCDTYFFK